MKRKNVARKSRRMSPPRQKRVSYAFASEYAKKLKVYSLTKQEFVYVYDEQRKKDEKLLEEQEKAKEENRKEEDTNV